MGKLHPASRAETRTLQKVRRNNRILEKFYDASYIDIRDGKKRKGAELCSGRVARNRELDTENLRKYRGEKLSKGRRSIRYTRYRLRPGDIVLYQGNKYTVKGCQHYGQYVALDGVAKAPRTDAVKLYSCCGGYKVI